MPGNREGKGVDPGYLLKVLAIMAIVFIAGFFFGQDHPRPGTTIDGQTAALLEKYEALEGPLPKPSVKPSKPGNFIQVVRDNSQPQVVADGKSKSVLLSLSFPLTGKMKGASQGVLIAINELSELKYIYPDRWTKLDTCSVMWVYDQSLGDKFTAYEVMPN